MRTLYSGIVASLIMLIPLFAGNISTAETDSLPTYWLSEIVITAPQKIESPVLPVWQTSANRIQQLDIGNASQALNLIPSLYLSTSAKNEKTFRLRGIDQRQISVFLDGIPISVPFNGLIDLAQFSGEDVARVRVSSGIASVLYGTNNIGGSVNIITREPTCARHFRLRLENNPQGKFLSSFSYGGSLGNLMYFTAFNFNRSANFVLPGNSPQMVNENGGRRDHSGYTKMSGLAKLRYVINSNHQAGFLFNWINNKFDIPPNALTLRPRFWKFPVWKRYLLSFNTAHSFKHLFLRSVWYFDRYLNTLKSYDDASYATQSKRYAFTSIYDDYSFGLNLYPEMHIIPFGKTAAVFSFKKDVHRQRSPNTDFNVYAVQSFNAGIEQNVTITPKLNVQVGADLNYLQPVKAQNYPVRDPLTLVNGQIAFRYHINDNLNIHLASGQKSRFPTLKELYSEYLGRSIANPDLKAEHGFNNEFGIDISRKSFRLNCNLFYNRLRDLIAPAVVNQNGGKPLTQMQNIGHALFYGFEVGLRQQWKKFNWYTHYTYLRANNQSSGRTSNHLEYRPEHQFFAMLAYAPFNKWALSLEWQGIFNQFYQNQDTGAWEGLNDYFILNARLRYEWNNSLQSYLRVNNILDRFYYSEWGVPMPGRQIILGVRFQL